MSDFEIKDGVLVKYHGKDKQVIIPSSVTSIGGWAFWLCKSLQSIVIPSSVTSIGVLAFSWCTSLKSIAIPSSVTSIGVWAFWGCESLNKITLPSRFKGQEDRLGIRKECKITYTDDDEKIIYSKN